MQFNSHCHIHNLQTVFTEETKNILDDKLKQREIPALFRKLILAVLSFCCRAKSGVDLSRGTKNGVVQILQELRGRGEAIDEAEIDELIDTALKMETDEEKYNTLVESFNALQKSRAVGDALKTDVEDVFKFIAIFFARSIDNVTDRIMRKVGSKNAIVPMMMDITNNHHEDWPRFRRQIEGYRLQVLRYPGQVFPFFAVNPERPNMMEAMKDALKRGFVGVKLYPSLGYSMDSKEMQDVLVRCAQLKAPTLMHCSPYGFHAGAVNAGRCNPGPWEKYLSDIPDLKICFGHFGDEQNFCYHGEIRPNSWTSCIVDLMRAFPGRVFADVSAHTGAAKCLYNYFMNLRALIDDPEVGNGILWGTDWPMIRITVSERNYWRLFQEELEEQQFKKISEVNPLRFLGFATGDQEMQPNIERYVEFLDNHGIVMDEEKPVWLQDSL